jgi:hypothetical protein
VSEFSLGPSLEEAEGGFELGDTTLDGIEVRGVGGEIQHPGSGGFHQLNGFEGVMKLDVIQHDDVARTQAGEPLYVDACTMQPKGSGLYFSSTNLNPPETNAADEKGHLQVKQTQRRQ